MSYTLSRRYTSPIETSSNGRIPAAPQRLRVSSVTNTAINLAWVLTDGKETSVEIQVRDSAGTWTALSSEAAGTESYADTGLSSNVAYAYRVRAVNSFGNSPWSNVVIDATTQTGSLLSNTLWWQRVLRAWIATFIQSDFDVTLVEMPDASATATDDEMWAAWLTFEDRMFTAPSTAPIRRASSYFTLAGIENGTVKLRSGRTRFVDTHTAAFYAYFDNPYNPYYDNAAIYRRTLVAVAVDEIQTVANLISQSNNRRSDYLGGYLAKWAMPYWMYLNHPGTAMDLVDANTHEAFLAGMRHVWDYIIPAYPGGSGGADMEAFQLKAMPYMYSLGVISKKEYVDRASFVVSKVMNPVGSNGFYHDHGGDSEIAIDLSYEGIWNSFMGEAAVAEHFLVPGVTICQDALDRTNRFMAHLSFIEYNPDGTGEHSGTPVGPSHFNTGSPGSLGSQWPHPSKDWESAYLSDGFRYRLHGWHDRIYYFCQKMVRSRADMIGDYGMNTARLNANNSGSSNPFVGANATVSDNWSNEHWTSRLPALVVHGVTGFYDEVYADQVAFSNEAHVLPPVLRTEDFVKNYAAHICSAKLGNVAAISHAGPIRSSWAGNPSSLRGGLSGFWVKNKGTFILGIGTGGQDDVPDTWNTYDTWSVNTVSGYTADGKFSEARYTGQGFVVTSVDPVGGIINVSDSANLSSLFKKGDLITIEDHGQNGYKEPVTAVLLSDATNAGGVTQIHVDRKLLSITTGRVYPVAFVAQEDGYIHYNRTPIDATKASTTVSGALVTGVVVDRKITVSSDGVRVDVELTSPGTDAIAAMWEQIPVFQGLDPESVAIEYWNGSAWATLTTSEVLASRVRLKRNVQSQNVYAYITFTNPEPIKLNSAQVKPGTNTYRSRNIQIRLFDTIMAKKKYLSYTISDTE